MTDHGFFDDNELENDGIPIVFCELPAAKKRNNFFRSTRRVNGDNDDDDDYDDDDDEDEDEYNYEEERERRDQNCQICALTDQSVRTEKLPQSISDFQNALSTQPRVLPEIEACKILSDMFNKRCYNRDQERPIEHRVGLRKINSLQISKII